MLDAGCCDCSADHAAILRSRRLSLCRLGIHHPQSLERETAKAGLPRTGDHQQAFGMRRRHGLRKR